MVRYENKSIITKIKVRFFLPHCLFMIVYSVEGGGGIAQGHDDPLQFPMPNDTSSDLAWRVDFSFIAVPRNGNRRHPHSD